MQKKEVDLLTAEVVRNRRLRRGVSVLVGLGMFLVPGTVLMGGFGPLSELVLYRNFLELPARVLVLFVLSWKWIWTEGSPLQILLTVLLLFCGIWAWCLLHSSRWRGHRIHKEDGVC